MIGAHHSEGRVYGHLYAGAEYRQAIYLLDQGDMFQLVVPAGISMYDMQITDRVRGQVVF